MEYVSLGIIFFALLSYTLSQGIVQTPRSLVKPVGAQAALLCSVEGSSNPYMYWYKQQPTQPLTLVSYSVTTQSVEENTLPHFTGERPTGQTFNLKTERLEGNDTAVYFCAWSHENFGSAVYFGGGTRLVVLEDGLNITEPKVVLFDPSQQEVKERGSATLVCLATNFYPDHVALSWSVNGMERMEGVKTDDHPTRDRDKMYSLSSRLRISKKEWLNPKTTFRCRVYFDPTSKTFTGETRGREGCGGATAESYRKSANTAKFTYVLLITKSGFYGVLVTLIAWKMKLNGGKNFS